VIRPERPGDEGAIRAAEVAAFGREAEAKVVDEMRGSDAFISELSLVAQDDDGGIVGHVMVSRGHVEPGGEPILLLGPIGVVPDRQGAGIGSALVEAALAGARQLGAGCVALLGDPAYYERFGFVHAEPLGLLPRPEWPSRAFQVAVLQADAVLPQGRVVYHQAFDA
jgi:putative acetyltransferase